MRSVKRSVIVPGEKLRLSTKALEIINSTGKIHLEKEDEFEVVSYDDRFIVVKSDALPGPSHAGRMDMKYFIAAE